jgi:cyclic-di-GMP phosphodiesterase TipF (flagellum assembly factor)
MIRISTIFVAICMILIAASLGMVLYTVVGLRPSEAAIIALAAFTFLLLYNAVSMRLKDRSHVGTQIADLSRGTADLARQVAEFGRRLAAVEGKVLTTDAMISGRVEPLAGEISELGGLINQLAVSVAVHDDALAELAARPVAASIEAAPAAADEATRAADSQGQAPQRDPIAESRRRDDAGTQAATALVNTIRAAVQANRIDLYLQPLVTLPQRKVRYYEVVSRLRDENDRLLAGSDFVDAAEQLGLMPKIDHQVMLRCVQVLRRLQVRSKDIGLFCNISVATLRDATIFAQCLEFLDANRALAGSFVIELKQSVFRGLGPLESEHLAALAQRGFHFSIDNVTDLRIEPRDLADRGVRFVKVPASLLLDPNRVSTSDIHPADLSDLLGRFGIDLVAERIEGERSVVDLLDYDVRYGQGFLFAPPRPLRTDAGSAPGDSAAGAKAAPKAAPKAAAKADVRADAARANGAAPTPAPRTREMLRPEATTQRTVGNAALISRARNSN